MLNVSKVFKHIKQVEKLVNLTRKDIKKPRSCKNKMLDAELPEYYINSLQSIIFSRKIRVPLVTTNTFFNFCQNKLMWFYILSTT